MKRINTWLATLALATAGFSLALAGPQVERASAMYWWSAQCGWVHVHVPGSSPSISMDGVTTENNMNFWANWGAYIWGSPAPDHLEYPVQTSWWNANFRTWSGDYGWTGWQGLTTIGNCGHEWYGDISYNMTYLRGVGDWYQQNRQAVVCHESGHLIGMDHKAGGCMAYGYYDPYWNHSQPVWPDQQDKDDIQFTYPVVHGT